MEKSTKRKLHDKINIIQNEMKVERCEMRLKSTIHTNEVIHHKMPVLHSYVCKLYIYVCVCVFVCMINIKRNIHKASNYREPNLIEL